MARAGKARSAIAASATASALGSTFGIVVLIMLLPVMRSLVPRIGPPEYFLLSVWGLVTIGTVIRGSTVKGLAMAGLGLMVSFIGLDPRTAAPRFTLGTLYLEDGLNVVPVFLGLFAMAEVIDLCTSGRVTISGRSEPEALGGSTREGLMAVLRNRALLLRSSLIGTVVGLIPGLGGTAAAFIAYGDAARRAGPDSTFGEGDVRGVIAPEAANDAKDGASLLTTLALGIPTGAGPAVLLGVLAIHGIRPGAELMTTGLPLAFALIWSLFLSNWLTSIVGFASVRHLTRLTVVRVSRLAPAILVLATMGAFAQQGRLADVWVAYAFGVIGYFMKRHEWPRIAFVMALVLGPLFEANLRLTLALQELDRIVFWSRPTVLALLALILFTLFASVSTRKERVQ
jgi:TctA family transporter